jgi:ribonuclease HI
MAREEEAAEILKALGNLPDDVLQRYLPTFPLERVREVLHSAIRVLPKPVKVAIKPQSLFTGQDAHKKGKLLLYTDGASRGNPGDAGAGIVILDGQGEEIAAQGRYLGTCTNNVAEYKALIMGLLQASQLGGRSIEIFLDSQLIVRQIQGLYKVKSSHLQPLFAKAQELLSTFENYEIRHIPREENKRADQLANQGINDRLGVGA